LIAFLCRFIATFIDTGSLIPIFRDDTIKVAYSTIRIFALLLVKNLNSQINMPQNKHNLEAQNHIRKILSICLIARVVSTSLMAYEGIFGNPKISLSVSFGWVMTIIDTAISILWFADFLLTKICILVAVNVCYCLSAGIYYPEFRIQVPERIIVPCVLVSMLIISYDINMKSNFLLKRSLKDQKIVYEKFLKRVQDPVMIFDKEHLIFSNGSARKEFGTTKEEQFEKFEKLTTKSHKTLCEEMQKRLSDEPVSPDSIKENKYFLYKHNVLKPDRIYTIAIVESDFFLRHKTVSLIIRDVTQEFLQESKKFDDRLKSMMLFALSHELRTPLNIVQDAMELAKSIDFTEEGKERYKNGKGAWNYLRNKINDTLTYAQILSGEFAIHKSHFNLHKFIDRLKKSAIFLIHDKKDKVSLNFHIVDKMISEYIGDKERLEQILFNILQNSAKNTDNGLIELYVINEKPNIIFEIKDTGCGIPDELISEIMQNSIENIWNHEIHMNSDYSNSREYTIIGLSISNMICQKMHGKLEIRSMLGKGTTFRLILPQKISTNSSESDNSSDKNAIDSPLTTLRIPSENIKINPLHSISRIPSYYLKSHFATEVRCGLQILIVDDNEYNRIIVKKMASKYSDHIEEAENGEIAIKKYKNIASCDSKILIFMDLDMPVMNGIQSTKKIRELKYDNKPCIIALTAFASESERKTCFEAGMDWFVSKPLTKDNLEEVIKKFT